jgi:hypothetical protein
MLTDHEIAIEILQGTLLKTVTKEIEAALIEAVPCTYEVRRSGRLSLIGRNKQANISMDSLPHIVNPYQSHYSILRFIVDCIGEDFGPPLLCVQISDSDSLIKIYVGLDNQNYTNWQAAHNRN